MTLYFVFIKMMKRTNSLTMLAFQSVKNQSLMSISSVCSILRFDIQLYIFELFLIVHLILDTIHSGEGRWYSTVGIVWCPSCIGCIAEQLKGIC